MRFRNMVLAAGIAPFLIAAQNSGTAPAPPAPSQDVKVASMDKVVCKKFPPPLGSRIGPRQVCKTQSEWDLIRQEEQDALDRVQSRKGFTGG